MSVRSGIDHGNHYAVDQKTHHIIQCHHLQQCSHILSPGMVLVDRHHGAGRRRGRGNRPENQGKIPIHMEQKPHRKCHQHPCCHSFQNRNQDNPRPCLLDNLLFKELPDAEGNESQRDITHKSHMG